MHILEIPSFFPPYGGEFCIEQSKALNLAGHEVRILASVQLSIKKSYREFFWAKTNTITTNIEGIDVIRKEIRSIPKCIHPNVKKWLKSVVKMFNNYIKTYGKPDIIHAHCAKWAGHAAMLISKKYNIPYVITEHLPSEILKTELKNNKVWQVNLLKQAYYNADMVIPVSEELVDNVAYYYGKGYNWTFISNTIDTEFFSYKKRQTINNRPFKFCCLANFTRRKGYDILLPAFVEYCNKYPNSELHIAGTNTDSHKLAEIIDKLPYKSNIKIWGKTDKTGVRNILYNCDCLVLATRGEVQPLSILEAMSTGIPVISTEVIPKSLRIAGGCFICSVNEITAFSRMMCHIRENYASIDGKKLSKEVEKMASLKAIGNKLSDLFTKIVNERHT